MSDAIQKITIQYDIKGNFDQAEKDLKDIAEADQQIVHGFNDVNTAAKKAGDTIAKESAQAATNTGKVTKSVDGLSTKFSSLRNVISSGFSVDSIKQLGSEMLNVGTATGKGSAAMQIFKIALASTGVGLLVVALGALYAYFQKTEEGGDRAARSMQTLKVVTEILTRYLAILGKYIADYLVVWVEIFTTVYGGLAKIVGYSLQGWAALAEALGMDGVAGSLQTAGQAMIDAEGNFRKMKKEAEDTGAAIANLQDEIEALTASLKIQNAELQTIIEKDLKALRNRTISYKEAIGIINEIGDAEQKMLNNNIALNDKNIMLWYRNTEALVNNKDQFYDLWNQYQQGTISGQQYVDMLNEFINTTENAGTATQEDVDGLVTLLVQREEYTRQSLVLGERLNNAKDAQYEKDKARIEKAFQDQLKDLQNKEKLLIREAQLNGKNEAEVTLLKKQELEKRIQLFEKYGRQETYEYKNMLLDRIQLDKDYTKQTANEVDQRTILRRKDEQNAIIEHQAFLEQQLSDELAAINAQAAADKKAQEEKLALRKQVEAQIQALVKQAGDTLFQIEKNKTDAQLAQINSRKNAEIAAAGDSKQAIAIINAKYAKEEAAVKRKQAVNDRSQALFNIGINAAQGATKTIASVGLPAAIPLLALEAGIVALQVAAVLSKPIPQFNKGTRSVPGQDLGRDSVLAMLRPGEAVVPVDQNRASKRLIDGILSGKIDDRMLNMNYSGIERTLSGISINQDMSGLEVKMDQMIKAVKGMPVSQLVFDKKGYHTYMVTDQNRSEFMNNYFRN